MIEDTNDTTQLPHVKQDDRPQRGLWAPGDYWCTCSDCKEHFWGDKRAQVCTDCSYGEKEVKWVDGEWVPVNVPVKSACDHCPANQSWDSRTCGTCDNKEQDGLSSPCLVCMDYCNYVEEDDSCTTE